MSTITTSSGSPSSAQPATSRTKRKPRAAAGAVGIQVVKAWIVESGSDDGHMAIVWAETRGKAKAGGAAELDLSFEEVGSVRRYPQLDNGVPGGLTLRQWQLANGWHWECQGCSNMCYQPEEDELEEDRTVIDPDGETVFCSKSCMDRYNQKWAWSNAVDQAVREEFERTCPGVQLSGVFHNEWYGFAYPVGEPMVTVFEFFGPREDYYERRRILRELEERAHEQATNPE